MNNSPILLKGRLNDTLDWTLAREEAVSRIEKGEQLFWEIDLGLFSNLKYPLSHQSQYLSLCLSLEHFRDTFWKEFQDQTQALYIYRGNVDFSRTFVWNEEQIANLQDWIKDYDEHNDVTPDLLKQSPEGQFLLSLFCRDTALDYLHLLTNRMPDGLNLVLNLNAEGTDDPLLLALLLDRECFLPLVYEVEGGVLKGVDSQASIGICLPPKGAYHPKQLVGLRREIVQLIEKEIPFRIIPENLLITEWDGLDYLIIAPSMVSPQGKRKLQGFSAAGGTVINAD